jgi:hypothetical protein
VPDSVRDTGRAMAAENVEVLRSIYDEWEERHLGAGREMFDPEVTVETFMSLHYDRREALEAAGLLE